MPRRWPTWSNTAVPEACRRSARRRTSELCRRCGLAGHLDSLGLGAGCRRGSARRPWSEPSSPAAGLTDTGDHLHDAGQFDVFQHALVGSTPSAISAGSSRDRRKHRQVALARQLVWWFYADLKLYKDDPTAIRRTAFEAALRSDLHPGHRLCRIDEAVARTHANKDELLLVLDRPDIPLHTNGSENAVRSFVTKRRISGETRSAAGKQARDTFLSLLKTCSKLAISFWDYLGARLKIPDADRVPWLPDLIRQNVPA